MKCPCCSRPMEVGFIQTGQRIAWTKKKHKISLHPKEGEIMLCNNVFKSACFDAHICKPCKKVVMDYSNKNVVEG